MDSLWAVTIEHDYYVKAISEIPEGSYDGATKYITLENLMLDPDVHHWRMEVLRDYWKCVDYRRTDV